MQYPPQIVKLLLVFSQTTSARGTIGSAERARCAWPGQLLSTGVLGEYIGSIFDESKRRPEYVVEELVNMGKD